jgi:hypothetical protein
MSAKRENLIVSENLRAWRRVAEGGARVPDSGGAAIVRGQEARKLRPEERLTGQIY